MSSQGKDHNGRDPMDRPPGDPERDPLWNPELEGDAELQRIEGLLGNFRHRAVEKEHQLWRRDSVVLGGVDDDSAGKGEARNPEGSEGFRRTWQRSRIWIPLAAGLLAFVGWRLSESVGSRGPAGPEDRGIVGSLARGSFFVDSEGEGPRALRNGDEVVAQDRDLVIEVADLGEVTLTPGTRLRIDEDEEALSSLYLEEGTVVASILAEPRTFQIGTPAGLTVDLGCVYSVSVGEDDVARLHVREGRVSFETEGRSVTVPAGARCESIPLRGPNAPVFAGVEPEFEALVRRLEGAEDPAAEDLAALVSQAQPADTLTLFHLMRNEEHPALRKAAYDGLKVFTHDPVGYTEKDALEGDEDALDAWFWDLQPWWP